MKNRKIKLYKKLSSFGLYTNKMDELKKCYLEYQMNPSSFHSWDSVKSEIEEEL